MCRIKEARDIHTSSHCRLSSLTYFLQPDQITELTLQIPDAGVEHLQVKAQAAEVDDVYMMWMQQHHQKMLTHVCI